MNLEHLISKYLDGELTAREDEILRRSIGEDELAREKFYSSVSLHLTINEDAAEIKTPEELVRETEDKIMMKILGSAPEPEKKRRRFAFVPALSGVMAVLFLISVFTISDFEFGSPKKKTDNVLNSKNNANVHLAAEKTGPEKISEQENEGGSLAVNAPSSAATTDIAEDVYEEPLVVSGGHGSMGTADPGNTSVSTVSSGSGSSSSADITAFVSNEMVIPVSGISTPEIDNDFQPDRVYFPELRKLPESGIYVFADYNNEVDNYVTGVIGTDDFDLLAAEMATEAEFARRSEKTVATSAIPVDNASAFKSSSIANDNSMGNVYNPIMVNRKLNDVLLSTHVGIDYFHGGFKTKTDKPVLNFSQSFGYPLNKSSKLGVELGYSEFTYDAKMQQSVHAASVISSDKGNKIEVVNPEEIIVITEIVPHQKRLYWGSVFFETDLLSFDGFSLKGRIGAGSTIDGLMGYSRILAEYMIFPGIYLNAGSDFRMFNASLVNTDNVNKNMRYSGSFIYGIQFKL